MGLAARLDAMADDIQREYQFTLSTAVANFARVIDGSDPAEPKVRRVLESSMYDNQVQFIGYSSRVLKSNALILMNNALDVAKANLSQEQKESLRELIDQDLSNLNHQYIGMQFRDTATVLKALKRITLQAGIATMRGGNRTAALIRARHGRVAGLEFVQADRSGRNWQSSVFIRAVTRQALLKVYVESFLFGRVSVGSDLAEVVYDDPDHDNHGLVFSISGKTEGYPSYDEISDQIYHPNSTASVGIAP